MADKGLQASQGLVGSVGIDPDLFHMMGRREGAERGFIDDRLVFQEERCFVAEEVE